MKKHPIRLFLLLLAVYLVFALPFRVMTLIPGFTDVRPVTALGPIYGVFFGPVGWFASACGNTIADAIGDALRWSSLAGFAANFFGFKAVHLRLVMVGPAATSSFTRARSSAPPFWRPPSSRPPSPAPIRKSTSPSSPAP